MPGGAGHEGGPGGSGNGGTAPERGGSDDKPLDGCITSETSDRPVELGCCTFTGAAGLDKHVARILCSGFGLTLGCFEMAVWRRWHDVDYQNLTGQFGMVPFFNFWNIFSDTSKTQNKRYDLLLHCEDRQDTSMVGGSIYLCIYICI